MYRWIDKMERRFGRYAIPDLTKYVAIGQGVMWVLIMLVEQRLIGWLQLTRSGLLHGQIWRAVSFIFMPILDTNPLWVLIDLYFLYYIGTSLERSWGSFRFNLYFVLSMAGSVVSCLLFGVYNGSALLYSLFFAFACLYPETQVLLFFIIPLKVKWLGIAAAVLCALSWLTASFVFKLATLLGLINFILFFGPRLIADYKAKRRRDEWRSQWK